MNDMSVDDVNVNDYADDHITDHIDVNVNDYADDHITDHIDNHITDHVDVNVNDYADNCDGGHESQPTTITRIIPTDINIRDYLPQPTLDPPITYTETSQPLTPKPFRGTFISYHDPIHFNNIIISASRLLQQLYTISRQQQRDMFGLSGGGSRHGYVYLNTYSATIDITLRMIYQFGVYYKRLIESYSPHHIIIVDDINDRSYPNDEWTYSMIEHVMQNEERSWITVIKQLRTLRHYIHGDEIDNFNNFERFLAEKYPQYYNFSIHDDIAKYRGKKVERDSMRRFVLAVTTAQMRIPKDVMKEVWKYVMDTIRANMNRLMRIVVKGKVDVNMDVIVRRSSSMVPIDIDARTTDPRTHHVTPSAINHNQHSSSPHSRRHHRDITVTVSIVTPTIQLNRLNPFPSTDEEDAYRYYHPDEFTPSAIRQSYNNNGIVDHFDYNIVHLFMSSRTLLITPLHVNVPNIYHLNRYDAVVYPPDRHRHHDYITDIPDPRASFTTNYRRRKHPRTLMSLFDVCEKAVGGTILDINSAYSISIFNDVRQLYRRHRQTELFPSMITEPEFIQVYRETYSTLLPAIIKSFNDISFVKIRDDDK